MEPQNNWKKWRTLLYLLGGAIVIYLLLYRNFNSWPVLVGLSVVAFLIWWGMYAGPKIFILFSAIALLLGFLNLWTFFEMLSEGNDLSSLDLGALVVKGLLYLYFLLLVPLWFSLRKSGNAKIAYGIKIFFDLLSFVLIVVSFLVIPPYFFLASTNSASALLFALYFFGFASIIFGWILIAKQFRSRMHAVAQNIAIGISAILLVIGFASIYLRYEPPPGSRTYTITDFKYGVLSRFPNFFYCDPDSSLIALKSEQSIAIERFPELQNNEEEFRAIIGHLTPSLKLYGKTTFTDEEKLAIYREHKRLSAVELKPIGKKNNIFAFRIQVKDGDALNSGTVMEGTIDASGPIQVTKQDEKFTAICP